MDFQSHISGIRIQEPLPRATFQLLSLFHLKISILRCPLHLAMGIWFMKSGFRNSIPEIAFGNEHLKTIEMPQVTIWVPHFKPFFKVKLQPVRAPLPPCLFAPSGGLPVGLNAPCQCQSLFYFWDEGEGWQISLICLLCLPMSMAGQWEDIEKILIENISLDEQFDEVKAQLL